MIRKINVQLIISNKSEIFELYSNDVTLRMDARLFIIRRTEHTILDI